MFHIREIAPNENSSVARVIQTVMPEFGCCGPGFAIHDDEVSHMYESYQGSGSCYFVVEKDSKILGGGGIAPLEGGRSNQCELRKMYLMPEARGTGVGRQLLEKCLSSAKEAGFTYCYLETTKQMLQAQKLYEKFGFEELQSPMGNTGHFSCDKWYGKRLS